MRLIENTAALAAWLDTLTDSHGQQLNRDQIAALLGVSRSALFYQTSDSATARADKIRPGLMATIEALTTLRDASPSQFFALVERRIVGISRAAPAAPGRPAGSARRAPAP